MVGIKRSLLVYDIFCQWFINFLLRVDHSPYLSIPRDMKLLGGIGDFHVKGHVIDCFARFTLLFIIGSGIIDGEILETLWSILNETSRSAKGSTLAHRSEILDDHMNHSNWKKLIGMGMSPNLGSILRLEVTLLTTYFQFPL
jgi:Kyakuja-Dileera-Zisupton transposase